MHGKASTLQGMNTRMKSWLKITAIAAGVVVLGTGAIIGGQAIRSALVQPESAPVVRIADDPTPTATPTPTVTPTPDAEPVVDAPPAPPVEETPVEAPADLCPAGTTSQSSDGYNDLSCAPDVCLTIRGIPDPAYPECDYFYAPEYYR